MLGVNLVAVVTVVPIFIAFQGGNVGVCLLLQVRSCGDLISGGVLLAGGGCAAVCIVALVAAVALEGANVETMCRFPAWGLLASTLWCTRFIWHNAWEAGSSQ